MAGQQQLSTSDDTTRSSNQKNVKVAESEDQWESRVIIISNRIRYVSFAASAYNQQQQHSFGRKAQQKTSQSLRPTGVIIQSHETSIGGDLDTDPALRFRIGGSCIIRESVKLKENCFARRRVSQGKWIEQFPGSGRAHQRGDIRVSESEEKPEEFAHLRVPRSSVFARGRSADAGTGT